MVATDFARAAAALGGRGGVPVPEPVVLAVPRARELLWQGLRHVAGPKAQWLPEYDRVAGWLAGNGGRGLLALGSCGRGKTLLVGRVVPVLVHAATRRVVTCYGAQDINADPDAACRRWLVYVDDVGTEGVSVRYGERRWVFPEMVDAAEKYGHLLLASTNLTVDELRRKYGERTVDRLRAVTVPVAFSGPSLRG